MFSYDSDTESNLVTLTPVSSKKIIDIHFYYYGYAISEGLDIFKDFTAHLTIKNKQMANV
jgi:hypothetical protein